MQVPNGILFSSQDVLTSGKYIFRLDKYGGLSPFIGRHPTDIHDCSIIPIPSGPALGRSTEQKDSDHRACIPDLSVNRFDFPDDNGSYFPSCLHIPPSGCSSCGDWRNMRDVPG
jgi:hypothetical protein